MFLRIFSASVLTLALAACGSDAETQTPEPEGEGVDCAIGPGSDFSNVCTLEVTSAQGFVIHHPDGGFRRFVLSQEAGAIVAVADGAEPIISQSYDEASGVAEFALAVDRYRLDMGLVASGSDD